MSGKTKPSRQELYEDLHGRIVRGDVRPGELMNETKVGDAYGLSRTPVREVFWRLADEGLLRIVPQVGTFVAPINIPAVFDAQFLRETLECRAITEAARLAGKQDVADLRTLLTQQTAAIASDDFAGFFVLDEQMHRRLMEIAAHPFVWPVIASAKAQLDRVRFLSLEDRSWPAMIMAQHRRIVSCVSAHDADGAAEVMRAHLRTAFAAIDRIAAKHPPFFEGDIPPHAQTLPA